ncbi:MAG: glycosyltransferase family 4 protein [Cyanobacteria bacterium]|nr:glycosyltransferase family 4 protein [Cyanobacteria bacterium CG_2015-16_32_12]NCO77287.1 glycosyltransferase family 4 protein [Cyanobacteria bacterium CG_2015-22_32_23]NCQ41088.1 glycosyltransferase family 4 protein [Cyanobacteria bacterium CG_2015-04_32_10]NCS86165.1 glycosyltransferase family 4 protein [Cyanobacteria bacterium CG_2015-02_32_10]
MKILILSTSVGALSSGIGGGVELTIYNLIHEMQKRNHLVKVIAPKGSFFDNADIIEIEGNLHIPAQTQSRDIPTIMPENSVLANMWEYARKIQSDYDVLINFAFDWLPFYLTSFFDTPIAHFISMGSLSDSLDQIMTETAKKYPYNFGVYTPSQAQTFPFSDICQHLGSGIDLSLYEFREKPEQKLAWLGRIAPEKALEDAVKASQISQIPLLIFGKIQDEDYWQNILQQHPNAPIEYKGFLSTIDLQKELGYCQALLMTPRWIEAFGNVAIEALACGVPVISYARGGPSEIIIHEKTGFLVTPDSIEGLVSAISRISEINRQDCREYAQQKYSLPVWGDGFEKWLKLVRKN